MKVAHRVEYRTADSHQLGQGTRHASGGLEDEDESADAGQDFDSHAATVRADAVQEHHC
ncbi:hypothetical protein [Nocardia sp. NPDC050793]|uniref:hypothetical protein n=1 Tax=Nocardia sp. NPDC050793 TaxID=3155159 RepID=UPI0034037FBC